MVSLAQNLPETNPYKSWLIILAPAVTLSIKYIWNFCSPEVALYVKTIRTNRARQKLLKQIDVLLKDPIISEEKKAMLRDKREQVRLSTVEELIKHFETITAS